jgi:hypothetical protein
MSGFQHIRYIYILGEHKYSVHKILLFPFFLKCNFINYFY